jgi:hypothetical protein
VKSKTCSRCKQEKRLSLFGKDKRTHDGRLTLCRACDKRPSVRAWAVANPERALLVPVKWRAKQLGVPFNLEASDIVIPEFCPILGVRIARPCRGAKRSRYTASVDRIIPGLGYVRGNIQVVSVKANMMKQDASLEELQAFARWVIEEAPALLARAAETAEERPQAAE